MAEEITKYVTRVEFDSAQALKKLAAYEKRMDTFNRKQGTLLKSQASMRQRVRSSQDTMMGQVSNKAKDTAFADMLRKEEAAAKLAGRQKEFNNKLELQHIRKQEQEALRAQKEVNKYKNQANNLELKNARNLERSLETLRSSYWYKKKYATEQERFVISTLKERLNKAKTNEEVTKAVRKAKLQLRLQQEATKQQQKQNFLMRRMQSSSEQYAGNMVSAFAAGAGLAGITAVGQKFESVNNTMLAVSASSEEAAENFQFVRDEAYRLGLGLAESGKNFAKMVSARGEMSLEDTKAAFTGVAEMSTLLGLSADESTRATNALQQMMSKGVISAEELTA